jgi:hypothetical protein
VRRTIIAAVLVVAAWGSAGCGASFTPDPGHVENRDPRPLASIYDAIVTVPGIAFPLLQAAGLSVDLTIEIDPGSLDPVTGAFTCVIEVNEVEVGGVARAFTAPSPLTCAGSAAGGDWSIDSFGPIEIGSPSQGTTSVMLSLSGTLSSDGRAIDGAALVTSTGETGAFHAVKQRRYLVAATDFGVTGTASLVKVRFNTTFVVERDLEAISGDPVARASGSGLYIVNRFFFDNIQTLDPGAGFRTALQFSTGNGSNPHDVLEVDPNRLYITRYEPPYNDILIAERGTGRYLGFIDLSPLALNASGTPRADGMAAAAGLVFVGLQDIDGSFLEYGPGIVAAVDPAIDAVVASITMQGRNPFGPPAIDPATGRLFYAMAGVFSGSLPRELSGGVEVVDPISLTTRGLLVDDDDLGGNVSSVAVVREGAAGAGYCVVTTTSGANVIRAFDPDTGAVRPGFIYQSASLLPEVVADGDGYLLVPLHDIGDPRLVVLDAATGRIVAAPRLSLPPFSIAVLTRELAAPP